MNFASESQKSWPVSTVRVGSAHLTSTEIDESSYMPGCEDMALRKASPDLSEPTV